MKSLLLSFLIFGFSTSTDLAPAELEWVTDYEDAFVQAKKEGKLVLINFTGSDWCGWCKRLDREVFSQPAFQEYAEENLVLLMLDYPRRTPQSKEVKIKNQQLAREFGVRGFPTILLAKPNQQVILRTGYQRGGAESYVRHLKRAIN